MITPAAGLESCFEDNRRQLLSLAYRMLGSLSDAEDIVQETYLRMRGVNPSEIESIAAYMRRTTIRLCLDQLKSARHQRETYVGPWLPEPLLSQDAVATEVSAERSSDVSFALMLMLERLSPLERAAFLLHEIFDAGYSDLANTLQRSEAACRQLVARARAHVGQLEARFEPAADEVDRVLAAFIQASQGGDTKALSHLLIEDAVLLSDGGGRVRAALKPIQGGSNVVRFLAGLARKWPIKEPVALRRESVNGLPGLVVHHAGEPHPTVFAFEFTPRGVSALYVIRNPEKTRRALRTLRAYGSSCTSLTP